MRIAPSILALLCLMTAASARADMLDLRVGAKGTVNGVVWTAPDSAPAGSAAAWGDNQFFVGGGGGIFGDLRLIKFIGLELGLMIESNSLTFTQTFNAFTYDYTTRFLQFRVPIIAKLVLPLGPLEMTFGVGPEFVAGLNADVAVSAAALQNAYSAEAGGGTFVDFDLGLNISIAKLFIPISLRFRLNVSQANAYADRVSRTGTLNTVDAIESFSFGLVFGLGWLFLDDSGDDDSDDDAE